MDLLQELRRRLAPHVVVTATRSPLLQPALVLRTEFPVLVSPEMRSPRLRRLEAAVAHVESGIADPGLHNAALLLAETPSVGGLPIPRLTEPGISEQPLGAWHPPSVVGCAFGPRQQHLDFGHVTDHHGHASGRVREPRAIVAPDGGRESDFLWATIENILQPPLRLNLPRDIDLPSRLYPYQNDGIAWLLRLDPGGLLGDDMGLGKTIQVIVALRLLVHARQARHALVVCPASVLRNWETELRKWAPLLQVVVAHGEAERRIGLWNAPAHVYITTYGTLREDIEAILPRMLLNGIDEFDVLVADEVHRAKNPGAQQTQALRRIPARRKWGLSGTPIENRLDELKAIYDCLHPKLFSTGPPRLQFDGIADTRPPGAEGLSPEDVKRRIEPFMLRRRKGDVLDDLPALVRTEQWLELAGPQRRAYEKAEGEGIVELNAKGDQLTVQHVLALITKLKQLCNFELAGGTSAKMDWLDENMDELLADDGAVIIASQFVDPAGVSAIAERLHSHRPLTYTGDLSQSQRSRVIEAFNTDPDCRVLVLSTHAGGEGINLQRANYVVHFDHPWTPSKAHQVEGRAHRIGQKRTVFVYHLWLQDTIEARIYEILERKQALYDFVIDDLARGVGESPLTEEEVFALFGLRPVRRAPRQATLADLLRMDPIRFEQLVAALWEAKGFRAQTTRASADGGIDVIARSGEGINPEWYAIQCKRHSGPVGRPDAQRLLGAIADEPRYKQAVLVATSGFSRECMEYANSIGRLSLVDGQALLRECEKHGVDIGPFMA